MIARLIDACTSRAWLVVAVAAALTTGAIAYAVTHFAIDTDTAKLISPDLPWRQREAAFDAAFAQRVDLVAIVIDAATPELAEQTAAALAGRLAADTSRFKTVRRPDGGAFFDREGLLFASTDEVRKTTETLIAAQPLLGMLAADPSVRGVANALSTMLAGAQRDPAAFEMLARPLATLADAFGTAVDGRAPPFSWRTMVAGGTSDPRELRRFVLVQPRLDYAALEPGAGATRAIREVAREVVGSNSAYVRVRLTGPVPLADEEFATLGEGAGVNAAIMLAAVLALLWLALRSARLVAAVLASLAVGLALTAAFGLAAFARFNLISAAFAVLFVGLGVDFGIQYCVAYRARRRANDELRAALRDAGSDVGGALALAAASTAVGFFAFAPTQYRGVSELGVIAGTGMLIAFVASITLLPALLVLLRPPPEIGAIGYVQLAPLDDAIARARRAILLGAGVMAVACLALLPRVEFDFNPINLKSPRAESVATLNDLMRDPVTTPNTIDVLAPSLSDANTLARKLETLAEVDHAMTLATFVPDDQDAKLALIQDAALLLDPVLHPSSVQSAPQDAEVVRALARAADALEQAQRSAPAAIRATLGRLASATRRLADAGAPQREAVRMALMPGLATTLEQLREALAAQPVTIDTLPGEIVRDWVAADGQARIEVFPKGDSNDNAVLARFVDAVRTLAPDATGAPVSIRESSRTIVHSFLLAGVLALAAIVVLLALTLHDARSVLLTLAPLLLAGAATLGICALTGFALNFENIIALPLLFGIGVAFDIYFIMAWRAGRAHLLESSLTRAVVFSALTTGTAFGSLWLSHHPGTASMGKLLALSLAMTLVAVLVFLPALLRAMPSRR